MEDKVSPILAPPLLTVKAELDEICKHVDSRRSWARDESPCRLVRLCLCGRNAGCPAACGYRREAQCGCPRIVSGYYCPHCGAQRVVRDWSQSYISQSVVLVCLHCHYGFSDTPVGRWLALKFDGTNARKFDRLKGIGQFAADHPRNHRMLARARLL